jgi:D-alanine-D-alanine ligase
MTQLRAGGKQIENASPDATSPVLAHAASTDDRAEIVEIKQGRGGADLMTARVVDTLDVIFPVLHGPYGEDGTVQGMLALTGIPYVGSEVLGSAAGMDKILMKSVFRDHGLPVAPYLGTTRAEWERDPAGVQMRAERLMQYPMFAKPSNMGSSVGVGKIHDPEEFAAAIDLAARYDRRIIIEQGVDGRECECGVLGNDAPEASVVGEVVPGNEFYDYRAKYIDDNSDLVIPAQIPDDVAAEIRRLSVAAFKALDCAGMARVDFFVERASSQVWINELNTIPGFTRISMYPKLWEASGVPYAELIDRLIALAFERHEDRVRNKKALDDVGSTLDV